MGTSIRPEVSSKKEYWLSRHRYYELKHFCLQYPEWKRNYRALDGFAPHSPGLRERVGRTPGDRLRGGKTLLQGADGDRRDGCTGGR